MKRLIAIALLAMVCQGCFFDADEVGMNSQGVYEFQLGVFTLTYVLGDYTMCVWNPSDMPAYMNIKICDYRMASAAFSAVRAPTTDRVLAVAS